MMFTLPFDEIDLSSIFFAKFECGAYWNIVTCVLCSEYILHNYINK